jgi:hypothetical protein
MKINKRDNRAEVSSKEAEHWDEMSRKLQEILDSWQRIENTAEKIDTRLGILVESKKHAQEVK